MVKRATVEREELGIEELIAEDFYWTRCNLTNAFGSMTAMSKHSHGVLEVGFLKYTHRSIAWVNGCIDVQGDINEACKYQN